MLLFLLACSTGGGDAPGTDDTASAATDGGADGWQVLADDCTPPAPASADPFVLLASEENTQEGGGWFTEIVDVAMLPEEDRILTAGQGGLVVFETDGDSIRTAGHAGAGEGGFVRYYHLLPVEPGWAWATHRDYGLDVVDIRDADAPVLGQRTTIAGAEGLDRWGDQLLVATTGGSVVVLDVTEPQSPLWLGQVDGLGRPWDVHVVGDHAYVADYDLGLVTLALSEDALPQVVHTVESAGLPFRLDSGRLGSGAGVLYMASGAGGLEVFDLSDPAAPLATAVLDPGGGSIDVGVGQDSVAVATQEAVVIYDLADPLQPTPRAYQETEQFAMAVDFGGDRYGVGDWNILGLWSLSEDQAPAIDPAVDTITFLDGAGSATVALTNRGGADLNLAGISVPDGVQARVDRSRVAPGDSATVELSWDGRELSQAQVCIASDDPGRPTVFLELAMGAEGEGKGIGQQAPDFVLTDLQGKTHRLSEQLGHPVVLAYFATW